MIHDDELFQGLVYFLISNRIDDECDSISKVATIYSLEIISEYKQSEISLRKHYLDLTINLDNWKDKNNHLTPIQTIKFIHDCGKQIFRSIHSDRMKRDFFMFNQYEEISLPMIKDIVKTFNVNRNYLLTDEYTNFTTYTKEK